jgi:hypothetical protein
MSYNTCILNQIKMTVMQAINQPVNQPTNQQMTMLMKNNVTNLPAAADDA